MDLEYGRIFFFNMQNIFFNMQLYFQHITLHNCFPGDSDCKESLCNMGDLGSIPGLGRFPGGGHGNPLQYSRLEAPHRQRSLVGYSPSVHGELDTTERLSTAQRSRV